MSAAPIPYSAPELQLLSSCWSECLATNVVYAILHRLTNKLSQLQLVLLLLLLRR